RVYTLLGDGELAEGSNWEAMLAAAHFGLDRLTAIVDRNTLQITGKTWEVCELEPLADKLRAFGWSVRDVDGHDVSSLAEVLGRVPFQPEKPSMIVARTIKGKGVPFMEDVPKWHHGVPDDEEYGRAMQALDAAERACMARPYSSSSGHAGPRRGGAGAGATAAPRIVTLAKQRNRSVGFTMACELGKPNLEAFAEAVLELARADRNVLVVTSDSRGSGKLVPFGGELPDQIVEVGIAEQNLVGIAAGLASAGKTVFAVSPACFLTARALEQIKNDVAYCDHPVNLVGISAGVSYGALGSTHHAIHDFAALRAIHNMCVVAPADNFETRAAIRAAATRPHPTYLRFGKRPMHHVHRPDTQFEIGKAAMLCDGSDVALVATGETVYHALSAAARLQADGLTCRVISVHTVKPLDAEAALRAAADCRALVTVEEHSVYGGLGEACAAVLAQSNVRTRMRIVGIPDEYTVTGSQPEIFAHYGISGEGLAKTALELLRGGSRRP
ncbi:MAG: transketolase C-terminal domain-containing protein, partial [Planctomycetota bacterium]